LTSTVVVLNEFRRRARAFIIKCFLAFTIEPFVHARNMTVTVVFFRRGSHTRT